VGYFSFGKEPKANFPIKQRNGGSENQSRRSKLSGFSFAVMRQIINSFYFELLLCYLMSAIGMNRQECKHK